MAELTSAEERRPRPGDVSLVVLLGVGSAVFAALYDAGGLWPFEVPLWVSALVSLVVPIPLIWRRRYPSQVAWLVSAVFVTAQVLGAMEPMVAQIAVFLAVYSIGAWQTDRQAAFLSRVLLCIAIFISLIVITAGQFNDLGELTVIQFAANAGISYLINVLFFGGAWIFGDRAWRQRELMTELREANEEVRRQGRQLADQALDLERVRIARELHDGVAHHITGVGIHAAAARRSLEKNPEKARESLQTIEASTRETVAELRTLVYTLRDTSGSPRDTPAPGGGGADPDGGGGADPDGGGGADPDGGGGADANGGANANGGTASADRTAGNPGLGDLPALVDDARRGGRRIEVETLGTPRPLTPIAELSVYRVIQESLTNCGRYAGADAEVAVRLRYGASELEIEVSDSRRPTAPDAALTEGGADRDSTTDDGHAGSAMRSPRGAGVGIVGMRERMSALGGSLEAGPKSRGGWLVRARLPYPSTGRIPA